MLKKKSILLIVLAFCMAGVIACFPSKIIESMTPLESPDSIHSNLTARDPLIIDDSGVGWPPFSYTWAEAVKETWCSGAGTEGSPYIIEGLMIDAGGETNCLIVRNSNAYFIIRNCQFSGTIAAALYAGAVQLETISHGIITGNFFTNNDPSGVVIRLNCQDLTVAGNRFYNDSNNGILVRDSIDITIFNNSISLSYRGINCGQSTGVIVDLNTVTMNTRGICMTSNNAIITRNNASLNEDVGIVIESSGCTIAENIADKNDIGILLQYSYYTNVTRNQINNNRIGINIQDSDNNSITKNTLLNNEECILEEISEGNDIRDNNCGSIGSIGSIGISGYSLILTMVIILNIGIVIWVTIKWKNLKVQFITT
jgi:parallel beta-helix repeat protein